MKKQRFSSKLLAFLMAILILAVSLPTYAFATLIDTADDDNAEEQMSSAAEEISFPKSEVYVLEEDIALRTENTKHFKLSDGTVKAVSYAQPVHYMDEDGNLIDIDNALTLNGNEYSTNNKQEIKFANKSGSTGLISIKDGEYKIDFTPLNTNKVSVEIENPQENNSRKFDDVKKLNNLVSYATYKNIYDGIDLEYVLVGNNIKENIIVNEKQESYEFSFEIKLSKLNAELINNAVVLTDSTTGEQVYEIPAPYMLDASGEYSGDVEYTLTQNGKWKYTLTVTANPEWINNTERQLPVKIDPTIGNNGITSVVRRSGSVEGYPSTLKVGNEYMSYLKLYSLPTLPNDAYLVDAFLSLKHISGEDVYIGAYQIIEDWSDITAYGGDYATTPTDYNYIVEKEDGTYGNNGWFTWDIYDIVHSWYSGEQNFGVALVEMHESEETVYFVASQEEKPIFEITYRDMKGVESYWSYLTQSAGFAGTGAVNLATGNLMFEISTLTTTENIFGYTPSLIYNSAIAGESYKYGAVQNGYWYSYVAEGFKLNMNETLIKKSYTDGNGNTAYYYVWADADGTEHYFLQSTKTNESNIYYDEDGLQLKLVETATEESTYCTIIDSGFNERIFNVLGGAPSSEGLAVYHLTQLKDKNGNILSFIMDGAHKPNDIRFTPSGTTQKTQLLGPLYNTDKKVTLIWCNETKEGVLFRHSDTPIGELNPTGGTYLREALYVKCDSSVSWRTLVNDFISDNDNQADGITVCASAKYEYDSQGRLVSVYNTLSEYTLMYFYDEVGRVEEILEIGDQTGEVINGAGQSVQISYFAGYTEVKTSGSDDVMGTDDDLINVYNFDTYGRATSVYTTNLDRTEIYGHSSGTYDNGEMSKNSINSKFGIGETSPNYILNGNFENATPNKYWLLSNAAAVNIYGYDKLNTKSLRFNLQSGASSATQYAYLSPGKYTLSLEVSSHEAQSVVLTLAIGNETKSLPITLDGDSTEPYLASHTFEVTSETSSYAMIKISAQSSSTVSSSTHVFIDNVMLAKTENIAEYNLVKHSGFEKTASSTSTVEFNEGDEWIVMDSGHLATLTNDSTKNIFITNTNDYMFGNVLKIKGSVSSSSMVAQSIVSKTAYTLENSTPDSYFDNISLHISGYSYAPDAVLCGNSSLYGILVYYKYITEETVNGETVLNEIRGETFVPFKPNVDTWQFAAGTLTIPRDMRLVDINIACVYSNNVGEALFDNISVTYSQCSNDYYAEYYEDTGKLKYEKQGKDEAFYYYNSNGLLADYFFNDHRTYNWYDSNYNLIRQELFYYISDYSSKDYNQILGSTRKCEQYQCVNYTYNDFGLLTAQEALEILTEPTFHEGDKVITTYEYYLETSSKIFGALKSTTDSLGRITRYFYDNKNGNLLSVIMPDNTGYIYSYDIENKLTGVVPAVYNGTTYSGVDNSAEVEYIYNNYDQLTSIIANGMTYYISYDAFGNQESVSAGTYDLVTNEYNDNDGKLIKTTYGNGTVVTYEYDNLERVSKITYTKLGQSAAYTYEYHTNGALYKVIDENAKKATVYEYDAIGELTAEYQYNTDTGIVENTNYFKYTDKGEIRAVYNVSSYRVNSQSNDYDSMYLLYTYTYNDARMLTTYDVMFLTDANSYLINYKYDNLGRIKEKTQVLDHSQNGLTANVITNTMSYSYLQGHNQSSSLLISEYISTVKKIDETLETSRFQYEYDSLGNITKVYKVVGSDATLMLQYSYDSFGRIIREDNSYTDKIYTYEYDNNGNILSENVYDKTTGNTTINTYSYSNSEWKDQLTSYNGGEIEYDALGNPTEFLGLNFTWNETNHLASVYENNELIATYTYNESGIRTSKTVNGVTHNYSLNGTLVTFESYGDIFIVYIYDESGSPIGMAIRNASTADLTEEQEEQFSYYLFAKNLQGDIIDIYDEAGNLAAEYTYNAWGEHTVVNHTSANIGNINPFRYRGYFYDSETGFYYLNTRYYSPQIKRFISADKVGYLGANGDLNSYNLYVYCSNNPVMYIDPNGNYNYPNFDIRTSLGWEDENFFYNSYLLRIGVSSYNTQAIVEHKGTIYTFASATVDISSILTCNWDAGFGYSISHNTSVEAYLSLDGVGINLEIFGGTFQVSSHVAGMTSFAIGHTAHTDDGNSTTTAFTFGLNTGVCVLIVIGVYEYVTTQSTSTLQYAYQKIIS